MGDSGRGKSTLAHTDAWNRISDDISPVVIDEAGVWMIPHFPQLKLSAQEQYPLKGSIRLPLSSLYLLCPIKDKQTHTFTAAPLKPAEAARVIIAHTVASRLFTPQRLVDHMTFAAQLAQRTPVYKLYYPWDIHNLPALRSAIADNDLAQA
ncbi:MAG: hypothetical protein V2J55_21185 [Candidatus Competibacteraceae bacterium]|jgi:hypothetical protein|nr:hypothetical protein [Candidatus Competibacteraceae bacterium]